MLSVEVRELIYSPYLPDKFNRNILSGSCIPTKTLVINHSHGL